MHRENEGGKDGKKGRREKIGKKRAKKVNSEIGWKKRENEGKKRVIGGRGKT